MSSRRETVPEQLEMEAVIEAILFVSNDPVPEDKLLEVFGEKAETTAQVALTNVIERYSRADGGVMIDSAGGGYRLVSRPDLHSYLRRFFEVTGTNKLSMPALETLAIVAYRQPITAPEISELRGVSSQGVLKKLLERRLIRITGRKEVVGKPFLYATTREFLMHFGLRRLAELPPLEQFEELFGGDTEAGGEVTPDLEEEAQKQEIEVAEADAEKSEKLAQARDEEQQEEAAANELPVHADEPSSEDSEESESDSLTNRISLAPGEPEAESPETLDSGKMDSIDAASGELDSEELGPEESNQAIDFGETSESDDESMLGEGTIDANDISDDTQEIDHGG